jgi:hypothetical protein
MFHAKTNALSFSCNSSFFPEPINPDLLHMIDAEANAQDGTASCADSLQEALLKDPPVKPPPVAVDM